ncbi:MAG: undecaprenyl-diphosphate phosphatase [Deltaproteobacteria bacterium]|jgi:undecaprenyl-diphosphatase|nr:undecaprenyl-diphosphate phosphatase [Deltaproteobacteria bacterium]
MTYLNAVILGILQGITEFLPVSSSGHLVLFQHLFKMKSSLLLNVALHFGTLGAIVFYYRNDIMDLAGVFFKRYLQGNQQQPEKVTLIWKIIAATLITASIGLLLKSPIEKLYYGKNTGIWLGLTFIITATLLFFTTFVGKLKYDQVSWLQAILIGTVQGFAVLPGISRSGITIALALFLGIKSSEASRFSFLLAIPAIIGATLLEIRNLNQINYPLPLLLGVFAAFFSGFLSLIFLIKLINKGKLNWFAYYLLPLGVFTFFYL